MGILYQTIKVSQEARKQIMISDLLVLGITEDKSGTSIHELDYYAVRHLLSITKIKEIDIDSPANKYF